MPSDSKLIIISGFPCAGKTHRAKQLAADFDVRKAGADARFARLRLHLVDDESLGVSRHAYKDARTEKNARAAEMSAVKRHLGRDDVVVADGLNYIKGFRYQLYCEAKALQTPSCVVQIGAPVDKCREQYNAICSAAAELHESYDSETFENLLYRYEEPNAMTRWDSPLFIVIPDDPTPPFDAIWEALLGPPSSADGNAKDVSTKKAPRGVTVRPNAATVLAPATEADYLYALDKDTSAVVAAIQRYQADHRDLGGHLGGDVRVDGVEDPVVLPAARALSVAELQRVRRQFLQMMRTQGTMQGAGGGRGRMERARIKDAFVGYLNDLWESE